MMRLPFRYLEPTFFAGLLDDPILYLRIRPKGRSLLFDCGQIHHLAKRVLRSIDAIFITHAHMDHFMGLDTFTRNVHVAPRTIELFGPPGIAGRLAHKLAAYDWNLAEPNWCSYRVREVHAGRIRTFVLPGPEGFSCRAEGDFPCPDRTIFRSPFLQVEAELCDHKIPALAFRITEGPSFLVDEGKIEAAGLVKGPWLRTLKRLFYGGWREREPLIVLRPGEDGTEELPVRNPAALYESIRRERPAPSIGYVTDVGFTGENLKKLRSLLRGVTLLICECSFLREDLDKARESYHLCSDDFSALVEELRPEYVLPMHLSKAYIGRSRLLYRQLRIPEGVTLIRIPERLTPRPLLPGETEVRESPD